MNKVYCTASSVQASTSFPGSSPSREREGEDPENEVVQVSHDNR